MTSSLMRQFENLVAASVENDFRDNHDFRRFGPEPQMDDEKPISLLSHARKRMKAIINAAGSAIDRNLDVNHRAKNAANDWIRPNIADLQWLYDHLSDQESRRLLVDLLAYRALGKRKVKLPLNTPGYWKQLEEIDQVALGAEVIDVGFMDFKLHVMDLAKFGYPLTIFKSPAGVMGQFVLEQYRCASYGSAIEVESGDVVIDAGGCWGDTALYFAVKAGERGKVYSFEFLPENLEIFRRNMDMNPAFARNIELIQNPVWSVSDVQLFVEANGPGTQVVPSSKNPGATKVSTLSIDDLAQAKHIEKLDFIKMDIEGAELQALIGAENTIRRFRPKLAIAIYHKFADFWEIPQWIAALGLDYRFSLRHFTIHAEETVLFATPNESKVAQA
jgi:FkbM family methyltransferase